MKTKKKQIGSCQALPNRKAHNFITKLLLGKDYNWVHALKDLPAGSLGFKHRCALHDHETALLLFLITKDPKVYFASILHDVLDKVCSDLKKKRKNK